MSVARSPWLVLLLLAVVEGVSSGCREAKLSRDCEALCSFDLEGKVTSCEVRAAVLLPTDSRYDISQPKVLPVLDLAIYKARSLGLLPYWLKMNFLLQDDLCDATYAQIGAIDSYSSCVHVFFGPTCEYCVASVGRIVKFLGAPLITTGGFTFDFTAKKTDCQDEYFMTIRIGTLSFRDIALFFIELIDRYNWKKIHLLYDINGQAQVAGRHTCQLMMKSMVEFIKKKQDFNYGTYDIDASTVEDYLQVLQDHVGTSYSGKYILTFSSIYILCVINIL